MTPLTIVVIKVRRSSCKVPVFFFSILTEIEISVQILANFSIAQFYENPSSGIRSCSMGKDGRTNMTKLTVAFRIFTKAPIEPFMEKLPFVRLSVYGPRPISGV